MSKLYTMADALKAAEGSAEFKRRRPRSASARRAISEGLKRANRGGRRAMKGAKSRVAGMGRKRKRGGMSGRKKAAIGAAAGVTAGAAALGARALGNRNRQRRLPGSTSMKSAAAPQLALPPSRRRRS